MSGMDFLKNLVDSKKRTLEGPASAPEKGPKKWKRRGDIAREKEAAEAVQEKAEKPTNGDAVLSAQQLAEEISKKEEEEKWKKLKEKQEKEAAAAEADEESPLSPDSKKNLLPREECFTRLRALQQPITLFGETDQQRHIRTMKAQAAKGVLEEDMHQGQRNDWVREIEGRGEETKGSSYMLDDDHEDGEEAEEAGGAAVDKPKPALTLEQVVIDWIKSGLKEWERALEARSDAEKASVHGRADTAMQKQTRRYLKILFERLEVKQCPGDILSKISKMINLVDKRLYLKANDVYLQLCIGNLPWPVGCTSTGIHERTGRNRITESNIAHVMNDENTRKFLQAFKRLMTFKQTLYPNLDKSKNFSKI